MPELPEVETIRRGLAAKITGQTIHQIKVLSAKNFLNPEQLPLVGCHILGLERRGKALIIQLERGLALMIHLRMTGQLIYIPKQDDSPTTRFAGGHPNENFLASLPNKQTRVYFILDHGTLFFNDQRKFGFIKVLLSEEIATDPFVGKLCFFRVYSGTVEAGSTVYNSVKENNERMGRILQMHANHRQDIEICYAGDIAAAVGLKNTTTGDTLCDPKHPVILESMEFPEPVIRVAIEPKTKAGQEKMGIALNKLAEEDPTFRTWTDEETGQTIIAGMGELHLEIIVDRLLREFKVEANVGAPQVAYRECIRRTAESNTKYARQSGGKGQYGHCIITIEPNEAGKGYEFVNAVVGGDVPKEYIPAIDQGIQGAMKAGILAGYPVEDVKVTLKGGSYHEVDSSEMAFKIAGSMAFKDAMAKADPAIMEPIMKVAVIVPDEYMGDVIGDLNSRRGQIQGMEALNGSQQVNAFVPLSNMFGYSTDLRSKTQGRGQYSMEPSHYAEVPKSIAEEIMAGRKKD